MPQPLPVPFHPQKADGYCLAACAQMVLGYLGITTTQDWIANQLGLITNVGIPASRIRRLKLPNIHIVYEHGDWETIPQHLKQNIPLITLIQAGEISQWEGHLFQHAIVITGINEQDAHLTVLDPAKTTPQTYLIDEFLLAWSEMDYLYATITK